MKVIFVKGKISEKQNVFQKADIKIKSIEDYYPLLDCRYFDIATRKIGGKVFSIYCDDEGLFNSENTVTLVTRDSNGVVVEKLVGNLIIFKHNEDGKTIGLTNEEQDLILNSLVRYFDNDRFTITKVISAEVEV